MRKRTLKILLGILFIVFLCWGCRALANFVSPLGFEGRPDVFYKKDEYYAFNYQTILQDAVEGKPVQLTLIPGEPEILPSGSPVVPWKQADYLQVASAVFLSVWGETPESWKLDEILSKTNCAGVDLGFQRMSFIFFKVEENEEAAMYVHTQREIFIVPEKKLIWIYEVETSPVKSWGWVNLEADEILPAEEALRIVEENGGTAARAGIDDCSISPRINAGANDDNWLVSYFSDHNFLMLEVDEKTGEIPR
ncbi:MAG: hypothetical protein C4557_08925 [Anaerolineaceae bacterium]|jgi:hypothetical protein|nr:MAG: hypothetical protein C4557_08925 [Anaerolineaceae bacterium]